MCGKILTPVDNKFKRFYINTKFKIGLKLGLLDELDFAIYTISKLHNLGCNFKFRSEYPNECWSLGDINSSVSKIFRIVPSARMIGPYTMIDRSNYTVIYSYHNDSRGCFLN